MQYVSALALASLSGKPATKDSITAILKATGKPVDDAQVDAVLASLKGRTIEDVISKGLSKVSVGAASSAPAPVAAKKQQKKQQPKKEEPKKAPEPAPAAEEEDFGIDLFG